MRRPILACSSDWHLERHAWVRHPTLMDDAYYSLEQIVDLCLELNIPLIAAGDLFDKTLPDSKSVWIALQQMTRMQQAGLDVLFTQGQHELNKDKPWLNLHSWPTHMHMHQVSMNGLTLAGLDYTPPSELKSKLATVCGKDIDVLICHQVWKEFMGNVPNVEASLSEVPLDKKIIVTGDFHSHECISVNTNTVLSPGSICLQSVNEPADKYVFILYDDLSTSSHKLKTRMVVNHELKTEQDLDDLLATVNSGYLGLQPDVPENIAKPILSIRYSESINNVYSRIMEEVGTERVHLFLRAIKVEPDVRTVVMDEAQKTIDLGLDGNLEKLCLKDSSTYRITKRLLSSAKPTEELKKLEQEYFEQFSERN